MTRLLGLDIGSVRIGVALSDPLGITAAPLEVIDRRRQEPLARIVALIAEHEVSGIVVGQPLRLDGEAGPAVEGVQAFVAELAARVSVPIALWDERLTTAQAEREMIADGVRRQKRRQSIDRVAAALILQSYLDSRGAR